MHGGIRGRCSRCQRLAAGLRPFEGAALAVCAALGRVVCAEPGALVEHLPWGAGKRPVIVAMMAFLARWARRISWRETARVFQTSWEAVYLSVEWFVEWGLHHRQWRGVASIGVDEIHWGRGLRADNFLTGSYRLTPPDIQSECRYRPSFTPHEHSARQLSD